MPYLSRPDAELFFRLEGAGPPLLLLAGTASDNASWGPLVPLLAGHFRLIMPDNRGSGRTRSAGTIEASAILEDTLAVLDHLGLDRVQVVGHSLGGTLGLLLARQAPGRVRRLATLAASSRIGAKELLLFSDMAALLSGGLAPEPWFRLLFQWLFAPPFFADPAQVAAAAEASVAYPFRQSPADFSRQVRMLSDMAPVEVAAIACPVLAIAGEADLLIPPRAVLAGHAGIADLETVVVPGAGHSVHWDALDAVAGALLSFFGAPAA